MLAAHAGELVDLGAAGEPVGQHDACRARRAAAPAAGPAPATATDIS